MTTIELARHDADERVSRLEHIVADYGRNITTAVERKARTDNLGRGLADAEQRLASARRTAAAL